MTNSNKNQNIAYVLIWIIWMALHMLVLLQASVAFRTALLDSLLSNLPLIGLSILLNNTFKFYQPGPKHAWNLAIWCFAITLIWLGINGFLSNLFLINDEHFFSIYQAGLFFRFILAFMLIGVSALIAWMNQIFIASKEENARHFEAEQLAKEAELNSLRQQLQPHFLFNSLNSVSALAVSNPVAARKMIQQLSDFLRGTMRKDNDSKISLKDELNHLDLYLEIEKVRFGHRMKTHVDLEKSAENARIPPLIILPLIENAIKYGLYDTLGEVCIEVSAKIVDGSLFVVVSNPFDPESAERHKGLGFGLQTLFRRLFLLYGRNDLLKISTNENIYSTTLILPQ